MHSLFCLIESLNELEAIVTSLFGNVQDKDATNFEYTYKHHPWGPEQLKHKFYVVPLAKQLQSLRLCFPLPDVRKYKLAVCIIVFGSALVS